MNSLTLFHIPVRAIFDLAPKFDNAAIVKLHCSFGYCFSIHMPGPPGELMTREKLILENDIRSQQLMSMGQN